MKRSVRPASERRARASRGFEPSSCRRRERLRLVDALPCFGRGRSVAVDHVLLDRSSVTAECRGRVERHALDIEIARSSGVK